MGVRVSYLSLLATESVETALANWVETFLKTRVFLCGAVLSGNRLDLAVSLSGEFCCSFLVHTRIVRLRLLARAHNIEPLKRFSGVVTLLSLLDFRIHHALVLK